MYGHYAATRRHYFVRCEKCGGSGIELQDQGHGNVAEIPCSYCDGQGQTYLAPHKDPVQWITLGVMLAICAVAGVLYYVFKGHIG